MVAPVYVGKDFDAVVARTTIRQQQQQQPQQIDDIMMYKETQLQQLVDNMVKEVTSMMDKLHVLVVGPGLGRCPVVFQAVARIVQVAQSQYRLPLVLDADALFMLTQPDYHQLLTNPINHQ
jgi:NAD(P)H-hydrate repair Nnr-like enzyme with NAD(P)H-hydrate dehydratase domain